MASCNQFHNSTSTTIVEPPTPVVNITACAVNVFGNQTEVITSCNNNSPFDTYANGCLAYVNLTSTVGNAQDNFTKCLLANGVDEFICSKNEGQTPSQTSTTKSAGSTTSPTTSPTASATTKGNGVGAVGISKSAAAIALVLSFGALIGMGV